LNQLVSDYQLNNLQFKGKTTGKGFHVSSTLKWRCVMKGVIFVFLISMLAFAETFTGVWMGTYAGDETGFWSVVIQPDGKVIGIARSPSVGIVQLTGTVTPTGLLTMYASGIGIGGPFIIEWEGMLQLPNGSGQWISSSGFKGTWSGSRLLSVLPSSEPIEEIRLVGPSTSVQTVVDSANPYDLIFVRRGSYPQQLYLSKTVNLLAELQTAVILPPCSTKPGGIGVASDNSFVIGFKIIDTTTPTGHPHSHFLIYVMGDKNIIALNEVIGRNATEDAGILVQGEKSEMLDGIASNNQILQNSISNTYMGINVGTIDSEHTASDTIVNYNILHNNVVGISIQVVYGLPLPIIEMHYNTFSNNVTGIEILHRGYSDIPPTTDYVDATLNWWGSIDGPTIDLNGDGVPEYVGGDVVRGYGFFSPWLGSNPDGDPNIPGVQITGPILIIVAPIGPEPPNGYLNKAIQGANELPFADIIEVFPGTYNVSTSVTQPVTIVSRPGSTTDTFLTGNIQLSNPNILIGRMGQGFTIEGDITITADVDASTIHINWNNILGTVINNGLGTLDATYNWWGSSHPAMHIVGPVNYYPYLPAPVEDVLAFMRLHGVDPDTAIFLMERGGLISEGLTILRLVKKYGFTLKEAEEIVKKYGFFRVGHAMDFATDYEDFVRLLLGYTPVPMGRAGAYVDRAVPGGVGEYQGCIVVAAYQQGDPIHISFELKDFQGNPVQGIGGWVTLIQLHDDSQQTVYYWNATRYNPDTKLQELTIPTARFPPGYYKIILGFRDGTHKEFIIAILPQK
jgi:hypothetical protein